MAVLPIYNIVAVPDAELYFKAEHYRSLTGREPVQDAKVILIVSREPLERGEVRAASFYPVGITGVITDLNRHGFVVIRLKSRVDINEMSVRGDGGIELDISRRNDIEDMDPEEAKRRLTAVKEELLEFAAHMPWADLLRGYAAHWTNLGQIA
ncbi:MAG: hypothetical protein IKD79_08025, partial [Oscillospiraceae bacterium]|nr:hypothetical protein [Oscillospiraceae bacterium]